MSSVSASNLRRYQYECFRHAQLSGDLARWAARLPLVQPFADGTQWDYAALLARSLIGCHGPVMVSTGISATKLPVLGRFGADPLRKITNHD